jgi:hypothetical protein
VRAAGASEEINGFSFVMSSVVSSVVMPALGRAEHALSDALAGITLEELTRSAEAFRQSASSP